LAFIADNKIWIKPRFDFCSSNAWQGNLHAMYGACRREKKKREDG
jgi:hypothetical protein